MTQNGVRPECGRECGRGCGRGCGRACGRECGRECGRSPEAEITLGGCKNGISDNI